jgi:signal peptidase II
MTKKTIARTLLILLVISMNIGCDQVTKTIVRNNIGEREQITLGRHFLLTKVENSGAFLSLGDSLSEITKSLLLSVFPVLLLGLGFYYLLTNNNISKAKLIGFCFVIGGGLGNIFDRIVHGSVTDFMHISFKFFQTGIFNMADVSIVFGVMTVATASIISKGRN